MQCVVQKLRMKTKQADCCCKSDAQMHALLGMLRPDWLSGYSAWKVMYTHMSGACLHAEAAQHQGMADQHVNYSPAIAQ